MKWGFASIGVVVMAMLTLIGMVYIIDLTILDDEDYYSLKESLSASMIDAIDLEYYQNTGYVKIVKEDLIDVFTRRFVDGSSFGKKGVSLYFYDIIESPPKASVLILDSSGTYSIAIDSDDVLQYDVNNRLDASIVYNPTFVSKGYYFVGTGNSISFDTSNLIVPNELSSCHIIDSEYFGDMSISDFDDYFVHRSAWFTEEYIDSLGYSSSDTRCEATISGVSGSSVVNISSGGCSGLWGAKVKLIWDCS